MKIEDKKKLAEFLGKEMLEKRELEGEYGEIVFFNDFLFYDPDIDAKQFKEVLEKLTEKQRSDTTNLLDEKYPMIDSEDWLQDFIWIANHMPEVIDAVLEII